MIIKTMVSMGKCTAVVGRLVVNAGHQRCILLYLVVAGHAKPEHRKVIMCHQVEQRVLLQIHSDRVDQNRDP